MTIRQRQEALLRLLRRQQSTTLNELALQLGVSKRTLIRDIGALREEGFVIDGDPGRGGGLRLNPHSLQLQPRLTVLEVFALLISVASLKALTQVPFLSLADEGLSKLEKSLPREKLPDLRQLLSCLYVGKLAPQVRLDNMGEMDPQLLPAFELAFSRRHPLRFNYQDAKGRCSQREVEPQAMLILPPLWYLVAWDPLREDVRHFRMDRISQPCAVTDQHFRRRLIRFEAGVRPLHPN